MKRILFVAPHCYPIKSSESICNSKVAYTLAKAGYHVDVFTCSDSSTYPADNKVDELLRKSENLEITSVSWKFMSRKMNLFSLLKLMFHYFLIYIRTGYYYNGIDAPYQIVKAIKNVIKKEGRMPYDAVITRGFNTDYVGIYMVKKYGIKWIANWNDPFPLERFPKPYGTGYDTKLPLYKQHVIDDIQKYATLHTFPNDRLRNYMLKCFNKISRSQTMVIHHMAHSELSLNNCSSNKIMRIVHSGSVNKPRCPQNFLKALSIVSKKTSLKIECLFVGGYDDNIGQLVKKYDLENIVKFQPSMTYSESLKFLSKSNLSLIIEAICDEGIYLPTKFVDALQCSTPVFCVSPHQGTLHDFVAKFNVGYSSDNTDVNSIVLQLKKAIDDFSSGSLPVIKQETVSCFFETYILNQFNEIL